ncbi:TATA box-binding protein-associated factor RNA polymerase I subunit B-like [Mercenaria mercenaria]|uniref:TATA box-binding protein-associated factor RNA polymerase I subunit B-like n=1 Tax=Mercenaria mercenaria TaxID=6596 RepID=UPI00234F8EC2|nr:TATA box-binding protein-associated factor RNA polymerase I subunit B-like [Mercenaria mercenaria]XP_053407097.1 TATA box-binding protein-associated factor RNA polymerase I subunit B-like [Mercenaria mercenaria]XP_053407098.1 TATA box-binding protein-associated factor RNA polymerase I subunit B-like [Mercenaria mercenaria]XP_053407099.1 TATA box-binding protein-associated factor RNA polymerase I subunit B-like [Mercenaria mercenaria]
MPECTVCGERDFEEHDGHYFCATCNTQSQDVRVIVAEEENFDNFRRSGLIKEAATPRQSKKQVGDHGRPWSVYEAYQIIIQHQVDALIKLGAQESLKEIVFQIWVNYLSKLGVAFSSDTVTNVKYERQRELFPSTTDQPRIKNVLGMKSRKRTLGLSAKKVHKQVEKEQTVEALQNEEFYEGDNPLNDSGDTETELTGGGWSSNEEDDSEQKWGRYRKSLKFNAVEKVRMTSTISVCFLGLMYTNPLTTASDLIRWIRKKKIPYIDVRAILPEDMKFCLNDWKLFGFGSPPTLEQIRQTAGTIAYYIQLKNFPDFPLDTLINKYIIQLDLPAEFHGYTMNLYSSMQINLRYKPSCQQKMTIFWECVAMAYIVILLKLFFGMNDSHEILLSEYTKELVEISECAQPLFVWTDWVQHMQNRIHVQNQQKSRTADRTLDGCGELSERIKATQYISKVKLYDKTVKDTLAQPFLELSQRWKLRHSDESRSSSGDPNLHEHNGISVDFDMNTLDEEDPLELLQLDYSTENDLNIWNGRSVHKEQECEMDKDMRSKSDSLRKSTVQHILSPETYLTVLQNRIDSNNPERRTPENDFDSILSEMIINDFYDSSASPSKRRKLEHSGNKNSQKNANDFDDEESAVHDKIEKYKAVIEKLKSVTSNVETSLDYEVQNVCLSYDWLLKICCHLIQCETKELQDMILKLEVMFFSDPDDLSLSIKGKDHRRKLRGGGLYFAKKLHGIKQENVK